jgi:hypothetical protein
MTLTVILGSGVGVRVEAAVLQGNHRRGRGSAVATETGLMVMMGGTGFVVKVLAEGRAITMTEVETGKRTGERTGDR